MIPDDQRRLPDESPGANAARDGSGNEDAGARPDGGLGEVPTTSADPRFAAASSTDPRFAATSSTERSTSSTPERARSASVLVALASFAHREYRIAARSRWPVGLAVLFAAFTVGVVQYGASGAGTSTVAAVVASIAALSTYVVPLAALAFGYSTIVGPRGRGELDVLFALPVPRWTVVAGAFLGRAAAFAGAVVLGYAFGGAALFRVGGASAVAAFLPAVGAAVLAGTAFVAISVLVSTVASEKAKALGGALLAWTWFVLVHDVAALTATVVLDLPASALAALVLANPADGLRILGMAGVPSANGAGALAATDLSASIVALALVAWTALAVGGASLATTRRD